MGFLNQPLVWGALAAAVPLILHILNRSRFRRIEWGAMHLLDSVIRVNHRRFRLEQLLLLLVRCAIPALLAFCLARPVLTGVDGLAGNAPVSLVVLLDTSYSMDTKTAGTSRFDAAADAAAAICGAAARGSDISVLLAGGGTQKLFDQPVTGPDAVVRRLNSVTSGYGAADMQQSVGDALALLSTMQNVQRELVVISDFQKADWDLSRSAAGALRDRTDSEEMPPRVTLLPVGADVSDNLLVDSLEFTQRPLGIGQPLTVRASLHNDSDSAVDDARVIFRTNGTEQAVSRVSLPAHASVQVLFPCEFEEAGSHVIDVELSGDDALQTDNRLSAAVTVLQEIEIVLVDGDPSSQPLQGETDYLSVALTPYSMGRLQLSDLMTTRTITNPAELSEDLLSWAKVVVLANVQRLDDVQTALLAEFVQGGGSLMVCAGNRIDTEWYNERLFREHGLLAAGFGMPQGDFDSEGDRAAIAAQHFDHPTLQFFNESGNGNLSAAEIRRWFRLEMHAGDDSEQHPVVMASLDNGDPFLVERTVGEGVVIQLATACDADWSDLPLQPFFVPLMQQLLSVTATRHAPLRNIRAGEPLVAVLPKDSSDAAVSVVTPEGIRETLQPSIQGSRRTARFAETRRPGVYSLTLPDGRSESYVAATSREESRSGMLGKAELAALAEGIGGQVVSDSEAYLRQNRLRRHGREIRNPVLAVLLLMMFLELVLQQRFSRVRT